MKTTALTDDLYQYLLNISLREHPILRALREATERLPLGIMSITPEQAQFMQFLLRLIRAKKVLELGTFTGYSALAMALALPKDGQIITCDINTTWTDVAQPFWQQAQQHQKIELRLGPALQTMEQLLLTGHAQSFDFIFIDADKTNYVHYYHRALELIAPKGVIAIDNIFWDGKVIDTEAQGAQLREIRKLNELIKQDDKVNISLLPIADGLFLIQKELLNE